MIFDSISLGSIGDSSGLKILSFVIQIIHFLMTHDALIDKERLIMKMVNDFEILEKNYTLIKKMIIKAQAKASMDGYIGVHGLDIW